MPFLLLSSQFVGCGRRARIWWDSKLQAVERGYPLDQGSQPSIGAGSFVQLLLSVARRTALFIYTGVRGHEAVDGNLGCLTSGEIIASDHLRWRSWNTQTKWRLRAIAVRLTGRSPQM